MLSSNQSSVSTKETDIQAEIDVLHIKLEAIQNRQFNQNTEKELFDLNEQIEEIKAKIQHQLNKLSRKNHKKLANKEKLSKLEKVKNFKILGKLKSLQKKIEPLSEKLKDKLIPLSLALRQEISALQMELDEIDFNKPENVKKRQESARNPEKVKAIVALFSSMIPGADFSKFKENSEKLKEALPSFEPSVQKEIIELLQKQMELNQRYLDNDKFDLEQAETDLKAYANNPKLKALNEKAVKDFEKKVQDRENFDNIVSEIIGSVLTYSDKGKEEALPENIEDIESNDEVFVLSESDHDSSDILPESAPNSGSSSTEEEIKKEAEALEQPQVPQKSPFEENQVVRLTALFNEKAKSQKIDEQKKVKVEQKKYPPVRLTVR